MASHRERIELANKITKQIVRKYGNQILLVGIYGSTARNEDKPRSDLEMIVITRNKSIPHQSFIYNDTAIYIWMETRKNATKAVKKLTVTWPVEVGKFLNPMVLYGSRNIVSEFNHVASTIPRESFLKIVRFTLRDSFEQLGRIENAVTYRNKGALTEASTWFGYSISLLVAVINRRYYLRHGFKSLSEAKKFKKLPKDYFPLMNVFWKSKDFRKVIESARKLWENCLDLARKDGVDLTFIQ